MSDIQSTFRTQGLVRPREGRILGGVFAGLGRRFGLEPWTSRVVFSLLMLAVPGSQILLYPILWIVMPSEDAPAPSAGVGPVTA